MEVSTIIGEANLDDLSTLLTLEQAIIESERPFDSCIKKSDTTYYDLETLIANADSQVVVADTGDEIVGSGYAQIRTSQQCFITEHFCYLGFIFVFPEYRGAGLARSILQPLTRWGKSRDIDYFLLDVLCAAAAWYQRKLRLVRDVSSYYSTSHYSR